MSEAEKFAIPVTPAWRIVRTSVATSQKENSCRHKPPLLSHKASGSIHPRPVLSSVDQGSNTVLSGVQPYLVPCAKFSPQNGFSRRTQLVVAVLVPRGQTPCYGVAPEVPFPIIVVKWKSSPNASCPWEWKLKHVLFHRIRKT